MKTLITSFLYLLFSLSNGISAQTKVQVVKKEIKHQFKWTGKSKLNIVGERAAIFCEVHDLDVIECVITVVSKHNEKAIAEKDVEKMMLKNQAVGHHIFLRNYIKVEKSTQPQASLKVFYHLKIPKNCPINISDYFGEVHVNGLTADLSITSDFTKIFIDQCQGKTQIESKFGSIDVTDFMGELKIESNRTNVELEKVGGNFSIQANVARIEIDEIDKVETFQLQLTKSQVFLNGIDPELYGFNLNLDKVKLKVKDGINLKKLANGEKRIEIQHNLNKASINGNIRMEMGLLSIK